ncbi:MAG: guanylate kinase [Candidatus Omnitrophica bacterium]|nr:guanylate kinase [Candidatus Omnitrophota bacterium]
MNRAQGAKKRNKAKGLVFVIAGPSGSGKTTLAQEVLRSSRLKARLNKSISFTTRPKRSRERQGKDYLFITPRQFRQYNKEKKIIEYTRYLGYYYGTPRQCVEKKLLQGKHLLMCLDLRGVRALKRLFPQNTVTIFVRPPSLEALSARIEKRCCHTEKSEIKKRLGLAKEELKASQGLDYCILNKDLSRAVGELRKIILKHIIA